MRVDQSLHFSPLRSALQGIVALWLLLASQLSAGQQTVIYPRPESKDDVRTSYPVAVLQLCENKSNQAFSLQPSKVSSQQGRSIRQLIKGTDMDIIWAHTNEEREKMLLPIRIPIDRGLLSWRMLLIRKSDSDLFQSITRREQLAALLAGQGHDWPDVDVLQANHLRVATSSTYEGLFLMLARGHIQYLPRSISEIWPELNSHSDLNLEVQKHLIIHYPAAFYFFVNKNNTQLASILTSCLQTASQDGSLRTLFNQYFHDTIIEADFAHKTIIALDNPQLPKATPLTTREYWFSPEELLQNE